VPTRGCQRLPSPAARFNTDPDSTVEMVEEKKCFRLV
jgi:hypothetical protein